MKKTLLFMIILIPLILYAQDMRERIVVMDLFGQNMKPDHLAELTQVLEKELDKTNKFIITDRSRINTFIEQYGVTQSECNTVPWLVRIGKNLNVDKVVAGSVNSTGMSITIHIRTIDVESKGIDKSASDFCKLCSIDDLFRKRMQYVALTLAGFKVDSRAYDSLFTFDMGPLIKLNADPNDSSIEKKISDRLFEGYNRKKVKRTFGASVLMYALGISLMSVPGFVMNINDKRENSGDFLIPQGIGTALVLTSIPLLKKANVMGKNLNMLSFDSLRHVVEKGIVLGLNTSNYNVNKNTSDDDPLFHYEYKTRPGFAAGCYLNFFLNHFITLHTEILYIQRGAEVEMSGPGLVRTYLNYLDFPLFLQCNYPVMKKFKLAGFFGFSPELLLNSKKRYVEANKDTDINDLPFIDIGLTFGINANIIFKKGTLTFELRHTEGIVDLGQSLPGADYGAKNRSMSLLIGCAL